MGGRGDEDLRWGESRNSSPVPSAALTGRQPLSRNPDGQAQQRRSATWLADLLGKSLTSLAGLSRPPKKMRFFFPASAPASHPMGFFGGRRIDLCAICGGRIVEKVQVDTDGAVSEGRDGGEKD